MNDEFPALERDPRSPLCRARGQLSDYEVKGVNSNCPGDEDDRIERTPVDEAACASLRRSYQKPEEVK